MEEKSHDQVKWRMLVDTCLIDIHYRRQVSLYIIDIHYMTFLEKKNF